MLFLDVRSPHFCIIRFYHIEIRFDEKDGIVMIDHKHISIHEDDSNRKDIFRRFSISWLVIPKNDQKS